MYINKAKVYKISEARPNLSGLVRDAANNPILVGKNGKPEVAIVDYKIAKKYLPQVYLQPQVAGQKLCEFAMEQEKKLKKIPTSDLASRVDEIVYGTNGK